MTPFRPTALAAILLLGLAAVTAGAPAPTATSWCGTHPSGLAESLAVHDFAARRLARADAADGAPPRVSGLAAATAAGPRVRQEGNVAVLEDDGSVVLAPNPFDFDGRVVRFQRKRNAFKVRRVAGTVNADLGEKLPLGDDDSFRVDFPAGFTFKLFGETYRSVWVNSDGNLTFERRDSESTARDLGRMLNGPPRISAFFDDFDPSAAAGDGGVYVRFAGNKMFVTWWNLPEWGEFNLNTFQAVLFSRGHVHVAFGPMAATAGIVGLAPGAGGGVELVDLTEELPFKSGRGLAVAERFADDVSIDEAALTGFFYQNFADRYDQIVYYSDFVYDLGGGTIAYHRTFQNQTRGIGQPVFDASRLYGSDGRLGGIVNMGWIDKYPDNLNQVALLVYSALGVLGHELGHQWLAFVDFIDGQNRRSSDLIGRGAAHWSFNLNTDSFMEGNRIVDNGGGRFSTVAQDHTYSPLDRYLMGLVPPADVPDFFYVAGSSRDPASAPQPGIDFSGQRTAVSVDDVIRAMGPRVPAAGDAQSEFNVAFVLVARPGTPVQAASVAKLNRIASEIAKVFRRETGGSGRLDPTLAAR